MSRLRLEASGPGAFTRPVEGDRSAIGLGRPVFLWRGIETEEQLDQALTWHARGELSRLIGEGKKVMVTVIDLFTAGSA